MVNRLKPIFAMAIVAQLALPVSQSLAFDGWHLEESITIAGKGAAWDYLSLEPSGKRLFIGHRKEGLQVFDVPGKKLVATIAGTASASSNGATLIPEFDLGLSNNENGTLTPFTLSTLQPGEPIKLGEELDTSHYDAATKRVIVNMASGADGTELVVLEAPSLKKLGTVKIPSKKPEQGEGDGQGNFYLAARDTEVVYKIDLKSMTLAATYPTPGCGQTNSLALDHAGKRIFVACRGNKSTPPSFAVMEMDGGKVIYTAEIGGGNDSLVYAPDLKRLFMANGVGAVLNIFEQVDANTYKPIEAVGTQSGVRALAYDSTGKKLYSVIADGSTDFAKKITTSVSPFYANTFRDNSFRVLVYSK